METLSLTVSPSSLLISQTDSFFVTVNATATGTTATPTITLGALPAGLTTTSTFPMSVPPAGATIYFATSSTIAAGSDTVSISGTAGDATATASLPLKVVAGAPNPLGFAIPLSDEVQLAQGSSTTITNEFISTNTNNPLYSVTLSTTGLPPGVTATVSPQLVEAGGANGTVDDESFTVTLTASSTAPLEQNVQWGIVATPAAGVSPTTANYVLDVTPAGGGAGWTNQTSYVSTRATPVAAVYDPAHKLIYSANQVWGRIDVINDQTRAIVKSISIQDPIGMDISVDGSTVWVTTECQVVYAINTSTLQTTQYVLPRYGVTSTSAGSSWEGAEVFALSDGTILLIFSPYTGSDEDGYPDGAIWNPKTGSFTQLAPPTAWGVVARSGDGTRVFSLGGFGGQPAFTYDVPSQTFSNAISNSDLPAYGGELAVNMDGSRVAIGSYGGGSFALYDGNLNLIAPLPGDGAAFVFSPDGQSIYEETAALAPLPVIDKIDVSNQLSISMAPAMLMEFPEPGASGGVIPSPFAVDSSGMVLGLQAGGIAFDDSNAEVNPVADQPGSPGFMGHMEPFIGPLAGGTQSGGFGNGFSITPDAYYGGIKTSVSLQSFDLTITSPPATNSGPVDVKMLFPDGTEIYNPLSFTYGAKIMDAIVSGAGPAGGAPAELDAFGLPPQEPSEDTVTVGGNAATITSGYTQYPPFTGEQTSEYLSFNAPSGAPGWADLTVTTPNGSSTLPRSFFFAKSVNDYPTTDTLTFPLYDKTRDQLYLSAGNHIDVFSLASNSFITALQPPAAGSNKQFQGLAMTPDGKYLLAADLTDYSLAVIDPDSPSSAYYVPVATGGMGVDYSCPTGPLFVAPDNLGNAYVVTGGAIGIACGPGGYKAIVNLASQTSSVMTPPSCGAFDFAGYVESTADGTLIAFTGGGGYGEFQLYVPAQGACIPAAAPAYSLGGVTVAADGNVIGLSRALLNSSGNILGRFAFPQVSNPGAIGGADPYGAGALQNPTLNDAGSLYYWAYPSYVDIVDVRHGTEALRFGLTETVTNTVAPIAIDSSGQHIFLITNQGLTVIDLGNAPLSVGHFSQASASSGNQIEIRGSGFENGIAATLGGVSAPLTFTDSETLNLTVPGASTGPEDLVLTNPDGTTYTLQNAINIQ